MRAVVRGSDQWSGVRGSLKLQVGACKFHTIHGHGREALNAKDAESAENAKESRGQKAEGQDPGVRGEGPRSSALCAGVGVGVRAGAGVK